MKLGFNKVVIKSIVLIGLILISLSNLTMSVQAQETNEDYLFEINLINYASDERNNTLELIQAELAKIGIKMNILRLSGMDVWERTWGYPIEVEGTEVPIYDEGGYDILVVGTASNGFEYDAYPDFTTVNGTRHYRPGFLYDFNNFDNLQFNALNRELYTETDPERIDSILSQIQSYLYYELPTIVWAYNDDMIFHDKNLDLTREQVTLMQSMAMQSGWAELGIEGESVLRFATERHDFSVSVFAVTVWLADTGSVIPFTNLVWESLYERDTNFDWQPHIAESMPEWDDENTTATIKIRNDVFFSDGHQLNAEDVVETYRMYLSTKDCCGPYSFWDFQPPYDILFPHFSSNDSITAIDEFTVQFTLDDPFPFPLSLFNYKILPAHHYGNHTHPTVDYELIDQAIRDEVNTTGANKLAIGSGPYIYNELGTEWYDTVGYRANDNYWKGQVKTDEIEFLVCNPFISRDWGEDVYFIDGTTQNCTQALQDEYFHYVGPRIMNALAYDYVGTYAHFDPGLVNEYDVDMDYLEYPTWGLHEMIINMIHPVIGTGLATPQGIANTAEAAEAARAIRQAISHAIPRDKMIEDIYGKGLPGITSALTPLMDGVDKSFKPYKYDLEKAMNMLAEVGYEVSNLDTDGDGMPNLYEIQHDLDPLRDDAGDDKDGDFLTNKQEYDLGLYFNPNNPIDVILTVFLVASVISFLAYRAYNRRRRNKRAIQEGYPSYNDKQEVLAAGFKSLDEQTEAKKNGFLSGKVRDLIVSSGCYTTIQLKEDWETLLKISTSEFKQSEINRMIEAISNTKSPDKLHQVEISSEDFLAVLGETIRKFDQTDKLVESILKLHMKKQSILVDLGRSAIEEYKKKITAQHKELIKYNELLSNSKEQRRVFFAKWGALLSAIKIAEDGMPIALSKLAEIVQTTEEHTEELLLLLLEENTMIGSYYASGKVYTKGVDIKDYIEHLLREIGEMDK
ncbi:MAG: ABC transporter substrate-binding protein [Candidatus Kariarchaeaceae archaeon]|jgi:ABC-type transport system substrate-binding protein